MFRMCLLFPWSGRWVSGIYGRPELTSFRAGGAQQRISASEETFVPSSIFCTGSLADLLWGLCQEVFAANVRNGGTKEAPPNCRCERPWLCRSRYPACFFPVAERISLVFSSTCVKQFHSCCRGVKRLLCAFFIGQWNDKVRFDTSRFVIFYLLFCWLWFHSPRSTGQCMNELLADNWIL